MAILTSIIGTLIFFFLANLLLYPFSFSFSYLLSSSGPSPSFLSFRYILFDLSVSWDCFVFRWWPTLSRQSAAVCATVLPVIAI